MAPPFPLVLPAVPGQEEPPVWTGGGFRVGADVVPVLCYDVGSSGWSDDLTELHESVAGADHYIDRASREHAVSRLERWLSGASPVVVDVGCSSGFLLKSLRVRLPHAQLIGADYLRAPLVRLFDALPNIPLLQFDLLRCPLPGQSVDGLIALNVLEHIEDDASAAAQLYRILKPGGIAVVEVPAGPRLYDIYDRQLLHVRRYRMRDLLALLRRAGFEIVERSHLGFFLYPAFWVVKQYNKRFVDASPATRKQVVVGHVRRFRASRLLHAIMRLEAALRYRVYYPFGIRCLVTCRRPS